LEILIGFKPKPIRYNVEVIRIELRRKASATQLITCERKVTVCFIEAKGDGVILRCVTIMLRSVTERATPIRDKVNRKVTKVNAFSVNTISCGEEVNG